MPWVGQTGIRWEGETSPFWVELMGIFAADADKLSTRDMSDTQRIPPGGTPGYAVMDLRAGWTLNDHLSLIVAVDNVTNEDYRIHGSGQNSPGRSVILSANASF
jgi:hemoglobin/transferrin/lactoferrin receptor protein